MDFIVKNFKKAGIFNTVLICITLLLQLYYMFLTPAYSYATFFDYFFCVAMIVALIFGMFYAFSGYKKSSAKYYKAFIYLSLLACLSFAIDDLLYINNPVFSSMTGTYASFIRVVPIALLAFVKDFGKRNSRICAYLQFALSLFIFVRGLVLYSEVITEIIVYACYLLLSAIMVVFVEEKYKDKAARGTK